MYSASRLTRRIAEIASLALLASCIDGVDPSSPARKPGRPNAEIMDAVHNGGKHGFYFLPPLVAAPTTAGTFDGALAPQVSVCEWTGSGCGVTVAEFSTTTGTGGAIVRVDPTAQQYVVNWDTKTCTTSSCTLDPSKTYRINISVNGVSLGHADVDVVSNGSALKNVQTDEYIALLDGRTLPIKFRAETGIVAQVSVTPSTVSITVGATQAFTATVTDLHGASLAAVPVMWSSSSVPVASVNGAGVATGVAPGVTQITATADGESGAATLTVTPAGPSGEIVVLSTRFGDARLVIMNADGSNARLVTSLVPQDDQPVPDLSPDKSTVVFASSGQVFKADVATGTVTQLTFEGAYTRYAKWSPDGQKIAFNSLRSNGHNLYIMNPDGSGVQQITNDPDDEFEPTWSPDGKRLAFLSDRNGAPQLYVVDIVTGVEQQVTFDEGAHNSPRWSQNSSLVAYMKDNTIWVVDVDNGLPPRQLTPAGASESEPCFSPDGTRIIFDSTRESGHPQLWSVNPDGTNLHLFIATPFNDTSPSWR
jgi:Tol biopolymer transport system component